MHRIYPWFCTQGLGEPHFEPEIEFVLITNKTRVLSLYCLLVSLTTLLWSLFWFSYTIYKLLLYYFWREENLQKCLNSLLAVNFTAGLIVYCSALDRKYSEHPCLYQAYLVVFIALGIELECSHMQYMHLAPLRYLSSPYPLSFWRIYLVLQNEVSLCLSADRLW